MGNSAVSLAAKFRPQAGPGLSQILSMLGECQLTIYHGNHIDINKKHDTLYCMAIKLEVKNLYKVFGEHPQRAFKYIEKGLSKEQILEKTGLSLGVKDASLAIEEGEIFVIMG